MSFLYFIISYFGLIWSHCVLRYIKQNELEYEYRLINDGRDDDAEFLGFVYRYIDDLITMNDIGFLYRVYKDIYPSEMVLNKTNMSDDKATS